MLTWKTHQCLVIKYNIPTVCFLSNFMDFITRISLMEQKKKKKKERVLIHPVSREGEDDSQAPQEGSLLKPLEEEIKRKQMSQESYRWASTLKLYMRADFRRKVFVKAPLFCQA